MQLAVIGLGTMGANLARNAASRGAKVSVYNRTTSKTEEFMSEFATEGDFVACETYKDLVESLTPPRAILVMVKAGPAVDAVIEDLLPLLDKGDMIIDGGNSHYPDTDRRVAYLKEKDIAFLGMGVSGGEEGALKGPSMMPGGKEEEFIHIKPLLEQMAADDGLGGKCVAYIGDGGSGHFVKMVHNGIEYAVMQLIAESYQLLKDLGGYTNQQLHETFAAWSDSEILNSFLLEITTDIFMKADDQGQSGELLDYILDAAGQKGTGKWTTVAALDYGVPIPTITAAVDARIISGDAHGRSMSQQYLPLAIDETEPVPASEKLRSMVKSSLEQGIILAYEQGFALMKKASKEHSWNLNLGEVARIWRGGCIIRSTYLQQLQDAYGQDGNKAQAATEFIMSRFTGERQRDWRKIMEVSAARGIPVPALAASLTYYDAYRTARLPQSLIQAQRDYFGAHTFQRTDKEGTFHADWNPTTHETH